MAARMSFLLTRPPGPLPSTPERSTLFSFARRRTSGELRPSLPWPRTAGAGAVFAAMLGAGGVAGAAEAGAAGAATGTDAAGAAALGAGDFCVAGVLGGAGVGAGAAAGVEADSALDAPAASITATTVWIGTVCPSLTLISFST